MQSTLESTVRALETDRKSVSRPRAAGNAPDWFKDVFRVSVLPDADPENNMGAIQVEAVAGRLLWLGQQRHLLEGTAHLLKQHKWGIGEAAPGLEWVTSDHPALKVNYSGPDAYDFGGGWGRPKVNLLLPLSPRHLLFCQIGDPIEDRFQFSVQETRLLNKLIVERAHRLVFARARSQVVARYRPRHVDAQAYQAEEDEWRNWHNSQAAAETWQEHDE